MQRIPNAKTTHRDATDIYTVRIRNTTSIEAIYQSKHGFHLGSRFRFHLVFRKCPIRIHPTLFIRALGNQKDKRILIRHRIFEEKTYAMKELITIVITPLPCPMQENHERHSLGRGLGFHGTIKAVRKRVVAFHIPSRLKQRRIGEWRSDILIPLRP